MGKLIKEGDQWRVKERGQWTVVVQLGGKKARGELTNEEMYQIASAIGQVFDEQHEVIYGQKKRHPPIRREAGPGGKGYYEIESDLDGKHYGVRVNGNGEIHMSAGHVPLRKDDPIAETIMINIAAALSQQCR